MTGIRNRQVKNRRNAIASMNLPREGAFKMQSPEGLTEEERAVLALLRKGATNIVIADGLSIKRSQASSLTDHLIRELGASTRDDLLDPNRKPAPASAL